MPKMQITKTNCFELYGIDFMIDCEFRPYLIEFNTNPCIETGCPVLAQVIGTVLDNIFKFSNWIFNIN